MDNRDKLYKDLENYGKENATAEFRPMNTKGRRRFPLNLVLLFAVIGFFVYLWQDGSLSYTPGDPNSKKFPSFLEKLFELASKNHTLARYVAKIDPGLAQKNSATFSSSPGPNGSANYGADFAPPQLSPDDPNYIPTEEDIRIGRFVQINGKYYKYNPEHIYMVGGVKTYFVNNRQPANNAAVDPNKKTEQ